MIARCVDRDDLARVKLFSTLSRRQLSGLARQTKVRQFGPGVEVVSEGTMSGVGFFIVVEGEAAVMVDAQEVARLGPGDYVGETRTRHRGREDGDGHGRHASAVTAT